MSAFKVIELLAPGAPWSTRDGKGPFTPHRAFASTGLPPVIDWFARDAER